MNDEENIEAPAEQDSEITQRVKKIAKSGMASYSHGSRSASYSSPETLLDVEARLERREIRRTRGLMADVDLGGAAF